MCVCVCVCVCVLCVFWGRAWKLYCSMPVIVKPSDSLWCALSVQTLPCVPGMSVDLCSTFTSLTMLTLEASLTL